MITETTINRLRGLSGWTGNVEALGREAVLFLAENPHFDPGWQPTPRVIRYYATQDVLTPPERTGRESKYCFFHLAELLAARALIAAGIKLNEVKDRLQGAKEEDFLKFIMRRLLDTAAARQGVVADPLLSEDTFATSKDRKQALKEVMRRLDPATKWDRPVFKTMTRLAVTRWCHVLIGRQELRCLTADQARDIGFAVTAALMDTEVRRGAGADPLDDD
jgi:DNA-binding transcriptional MerR regulator